MKGLDLSVERTSVVLYSFSFNPKKHLLIVCVVARVLLNEGIPCFFGTLLTKHRGFRHSSETRRLKLVFITKSDCYRVIKFLDAIVFSEITFEMFSHDVTAAILVSQSNENAVMLLSQTNSVVVEHFSVLCKHFLLYKFEYVYFSSFSFWLLL